MIDVGLESILARVHMLTFAEPKQILLSDESWKDIEFEVALDSCLWSMSARWTTSRGIDSASRRAVDGDKSFSWDKGASSPIWVRVS